jgi:hypothetical protein
MVVLVTTYPCRSGYTPPASPERDPSRINPTCVVTLDAMACPPAATIVTLVPKIDATSWVGWSSGVPGSY